MARSSTKKRGGASSNGKGPKVAFTKSADERSVGNKVYLRLNDDEKFLGFALFDPDPAAEDNPGYVEYGEHWDQPNTRFVPCWGAKNGCIYCKAGQQPSQRALAAFLVTEINGEKLSEPEIRLFRMNWTMIQEWADTLDEDGSTLGQKIRVKCVSRADGDYTTKFFEKDRLSKKEIKSATKDIPDIPELLQRNLDKALEALRVSEILEDDEDEEDEDILDEEDEEEEEPKAKSRSRRNKKVDEDEEEDDDDEDEDEDDDEEEDDEEDESDDEEDDEEESDDDEEEEDEEDDDDSESDDEEDEESEDETVTGEFTVVSGNEEEQTVTLKELGSDLYFSQDIVGDVDFDIKKGTKVNVSATKDDEDDWVATEFSVVEKKSSKGGKPKGGKKRR